MNFKIFLLLSVFFIISVSVESKKEKSTKKALQEQVNKAADTVNDSVVQPVEEAFDKDVVQPAPQKKMNIPEITSRCSVIVKNLSVKGIVEFIPSKNEAEENMRELGKILKISEIKDEAERHSKFADHPELKSLLEKLKKVKGLQAKSEKDQENALKNNEDMLETVVRLSMLDTTNRKSPIYGMNVNKLLGLHKAVDDEEKKVEVKSPMKRKYINRDGKIRLIFSKVIPPGQEIPDSNTIKYTDEKGRQCICAC